MLVPAAGASTGIDAREPLKKQHVSRSSEFVAILQSVETFEVILNDRLLIARIFPRTRVATESKEDERPNFQPNRK